MQNLHLIAARNTLLLIIAIAMIVGVIVGLTYIHPIMIVVAFAAGGIAVVYWIFLQDARDDEAIHRSASSAERWVHTNLKDGE